jgi:hypothetical protein
VFPPRENDSIEIEYAINNHDIIILVMGVLEIVKLISPKREMLVSLNGVSAIKIE